MERILENIQKYILYIVIGLFPVFVLSSFTSPYVVSKEVLLVLGVALIFILLLVRMVIKGSFSISLGKFDLGVFLIAVAYLVSTFLATPNKMEAYLIPGTTNFVLGGAILYFLLNQFDHKLKHFAGIALFISGVLLSLISLFASLGAFAKIPQLPAFMKDASFNPMGGIIPSILVLTAIMLFSVGMVIKERESIKKLFYSVSLGVIVFGVIILIASILPGKPQSPRFTRVSDSWEIAVDTLKKSPFAGVGPANYLTAFNLFRPVTYNNTDLWQVRFTTGSNFYLTLLTETGFIGLFALAVLIIRIYKFLLHDLKFSKDPEVLSVNFEKLSLVILLLLFAVLPVAPPVIVILFTILSLISNSPSKTVNLNASTSDSKIITSRIPSIILATPFLLATAAVLFFGVKIIAAETTFKKSLDALVANDAKKTYDLMSSAIRQNPRVDRYHASFAQVDMALVNSLAAKETVSDTDRTAISQLVQEAIAEGKATVALNPQRSGNWEVLAQIYRSIMPYAQGADQFAVQTYTQAIALDPINPNLRISLGGIYYTSGAFDTAVEIFKLAVLAKPDLANAHYNLAIAYREKKDYTNAISEIKSVLKLVDPKSQDYALATKTLEDLEKNKPGSNTPQATENLNPPQPAQDSNVTPPLTLPKEATPPAATNQ